MDSEVYLDQQAFMNQYLVQWFNSVLTYDQEGTQSGTVESQTPEQMGGVGPYLGDAGMTVLIGLVVVFSVLVVLTAIFKLFGVTLGGVKPQAKPIESDKLDAANKKQQRQAKALQTQKAAAKSAAAEPAVQTGISEEVVAAIAAAVACMAPDGKRYRVRSVSRAKGERPAWATAGVMENTRPF